MHARHIAVNTTPETAGPWTATRTEDLMHDAHQQSIAYPSGRLPEFNLPLLSLQDPAPLVSGHRF